ncbi:MAG: endonuclease Q family protein [Bacillota bacterium]|nr:endonuclease Q family protein [Bacillota bacterium]
MEGLLADLHVHTGRARGRPVKVTASARLTVDAALCEARCRKGLQVIGLADCLAGPVLAELRLREESGDLSTAPGGGLIAAASSPPRSRGGLLLVPGCEVELLVYGTPVHFLVYLPDLAACESLRTALAPRMRNPDLGCQRAHGLGPAELASLAHEFGGVFGLAHAFTPHRGYFGGTGRGLGDLFGGGTGAGCSVDFVEMGLSADVSMASLLGELAGVPLLASSDAHGTATIAREATLLQVERASFQELKHALAGQRGRTIRAYYGLDPRLGKYHRSACKACGWTAAAGDPATLECPVCGESRRVVPGVLDRILVLAGAWGATGHGSSSRAERPPYHHQVPLSFLPGVGRVARDKLLVRFGSEIAVLHRVPQADLALCAGEAAAGIIVAARRGELSLSAGGGGTFGRASAAPRVPPPGPPVSR